MDKKLAHLEGIIKKRGYKLTQQKKILLRQLYRAKKHMTAKDLYEKVKDKDIGLATVYRTLNLFKGLGIIKEIIIKEKSYYEMKIYSKKSLHIHFKCDKCNSIIDIDDNDINIGLLKLNNQVEDKYNIQVFDSNIILNEICSKCRED